MEVRFVPLAKQHQKEVMDIFNDYVENSFAAYPDQKLPYDAFFMFLKSAEEYPAYAMTLKNTEKVIGFCLLRPYHPFSSFNGTAEVSYFIDKAYVGQGFGTIALSLLETDAHRLHIKMLLANISSKNDASLAFHQKHGFLECGRFRGIGRKLGQYFDVVWMQKNLD